MPLALYMDQHVPRAITTGLRLRDVDVAARRIDEEAQRREHVAGPHEQQGGLQADGGDEVAAEQAPDRDTGKDTRRDHPEHSPRSSVGTRWYVAVMRRGLIGAAARPSATMAPRMMRKEG